KPDMDMIAIERSKVFAFVDARWVNSPAVHAGFVKVEFSLVVTAKIVDDADHKLKWVVSLEKKALIAFHCVTRGMPLREGKTREALNFIPDALSYFPFVTSPVTLFKETLPDEIKLFARPVFAGHA